ncbi:microtubule-associated protein 10 [Stegostoma tigrinum]|uniref:microtubule-associated protein 10 n=1 Tax=Stegostoma tigrinum TaxID=3053191 RepID=UPI00286FDD61|nr:microtubule-associated protein 10 [Stegostoma tigrinum]
MTVSESPAKAPAMETLFSLELLVDYVRFEPGPWTTGSRPLLAVAFRLLDFPTLLVHQVEPERAECIRRSSASDKKQAIPERLSNGCNIPFSKGKSCLFKISLASLHSHLSNTPLYAMLLDVFPRVPKFLGSCLISLADAVEQIRREVAERGITVPSMHGSKGLHALYNLMGRRIGHISVAYRLLSLGAALLPHGRENLTVGMPDAQKLAVKPVEAPVLPDEPAVTEQVNKKNEEFTPQDAAKTLFRSATCPDPVAGNQILDQKVQISDSEVPVVTSMPTEEKRKPNKPTEGEHVEHQMGQQRLETERSVDLGVDNVFCPPPMYYTRSTNESKERKAEVRRALEPDTMSASPEQRDTDDGESFEISQNLNYSRLPASQSKMTSRLKPQVNDTMPHLDPSNNISQLPLLNALLIELSLLHDQVPHRIPLTIHPKLAWLYSGLENDSPKFHKPTSSTSSEHLTSTSSNLKNQKEKFQNHPISLKHFKKENTTKQTITRNNSKHPKRKLMYGLTHTLRLRLQQTNPDMLILHEQRELSRRKQLKERKTAATYYKGKEGSAPSKFLPEDHHLSAAFSFQSGCFEENVETLIENSVELDSLHSSKVLGNRKTKSTNNFGETSKLENVTNKEQICVRTLGPTSKESNFQLLDKATNERVLFGKDVKISLPKIFNLDSDHSVTESFNGAENVLQTSEINPDSIIDSTKAEDSNAQISSSSYNDSADPKYSEDFTSPEATGFSEDFTSPEPTSKCTDNLDSSIEAISTKAKHMYFNNASESNLSKHFNNGEAQSEREDDSVLLPIPSQQSPIRSLKGICNVKSHQQKVATSDVSNDATSSTEVNQFRNTLNLTNNEENKKPLESTLLQGDISAVSIELPKFSSSPIGCKPLEDSQSSGTSQMNSYITFSVSDLPCGELEINTTDIQKGVSELDATGMANECRHISELITNKLPGYTL